MKTQKIGVGTILKINVLIQGDCEPLGTKYGAYNGRQIRRGKNVEKCFPSIVGLTSISPTSKFFEIIQ